MDSRNVTPELGERQDFNDAAQASKPELSLTRPDRRLLLGASLRVLQDRFSHGRPIFQSDVLRVATLADDAREQAA